MHGDEGDDGNDGDDGADDDDDDDDDDTNADGDCHQVGRWSKCFSGAVELEGPGVPSPNQFLNNHSR